MKIVISIGTLGLGGAEKQAVWLANKLSSIHEVTLLTFYGGSRESDLEPGVRHKVVVPQTTTGKDKSENSEIEASFNPDQYASTIDTSFNHNILARKNKAIQRFSDNAKVAKNNLESEVILNYTFINKCHDIFFSFAYNCAKKFYRIFRKLKSLKHFLMGKLGIRSLLDKYQLRYRDFAYTLSVYFKFHSELTIEKPDLVVTFLYHDTLMIGLASILRKKKPIIVVGRRSPIGYADVTRSFSERFLIRIIYFFCDAAISNSVENVQQGVREGISKNKFKIIPNFLNDPGYIKAHSIEQGPMKLVFIGNFIWYKNQEKFIRALASLEGSQQRFEVTFIGDGPLKEPLQSLASQLRIEATFLGSITNPSSLLRNFDALVLTSLYEGSSNALLEALSHGLPALTSDLLSTRELLNEGAPIVLCNPQDISSIESAIINLEHKFVDLTKISPNFSQKLISKHNPTRIIELWEQTFASLISDK